jgi:predicted acetyltransferase
MVPAVTIQIRPIRDDEVAAYLDAITTGFLGRPAIAKIADEVRPLWDLQRCHAAFDGDRICGTFRSWATELTVPGGASLPASAISAVTVRPTHRRRGILRSMVASEHEAAVARGESVAILHSAEYPIYGRFGYGMACREAVWTLTTANTAFHGEPTGSIDLVTIDPTTRDEAHAVFEAWRRRMPGEIRRRDYHWDYDLGLRHSAWDDDWKGFLALHRDASGVADGYARYSTGDDKWASGQPRNTIKLNELHALTDDAEAGLWRYLAEIDWVAIVRAERRSPSDRLPWLLTNARAAEMSDVLDGLWVRLFDVAGALAARTYAGDGDLVLEVIDPAAAGGRLRVRLEAGTNGARCTPTDAQPDLTIDIAALGAIYLGGTRLRDAVLATGYDEHRAGALLEAERLFRTAAEPWCSTFF